MQPRFKKISPLAQLKSDVEAFPVIYDEETQLYLAALMQEGKPRSGVRRTKSTRLDLQPTGSKLSKRFAEGSKMPRRW